MSAQGPLWQIDIQKRMGEEYWTNVYHCARSNQAAARDLANELAGLEVSIHMNIVQFVSLSVRPFPGPAEGTVYPIGLPGAEGAVDYLPLFNVLRVDFPAPTGRPSRKFYRLPLAESNATNGSVNEASRLGYQSAFDNFFASPASAGLCDVDGQLLTSARVMGAVGMRQLRRGSKRRRTPVI